VNRVDSRNRLKKGRGNGDKHEKYAIFVPVRRPGKEKGDVPMNRGARIVTVLLVLVALSLSSCGGGGGSPSASSPYTGITTAAVVTAANADNIARQAFQGGDLGANATLAPAREGDVRAAAGRPMALTLVRLLSGAAAAALPASPSTRAPAPRAVVTVSDVIDDGWGQGGQARYTLSVDNVTGVFTGTFVFDRFHGDGGGVINGPVAVSGIAGQVSMQILFDFQSVHVVDPVSGEDVTAFGTVNMTIDLGTGNVAGGVTINMVFVDNLTHKTLWLSNVTLTENIGTGFSDATLSGRIYLHDYGYLTMTTLVPFHYLAGNSYPSAGQFTVTGKDNHKVQLTVVDPTQYLLDVDTNGDGAWEVTAVVTHW
jgi:hypothetical protein